MLIIPMLRRLIVILTSGVFDEVLLSVIGRASGGKTVVGT